MFGGHSSVISSYLDWWAEAGLVDGVGDSPLDWFAPPQPVPAAPPAASPRLNDAGQTVRQPTAAVAPAGLTRDAPSADLPPLPDDLAAFDAWLASGPALPGRDWSSAAVAPQGPLATPLMIMADVPDADDLAAGTLFSGQAGRLLDAMLAAIGLQRQQVRLATIALTRPPAGRLEGADVAPLLAMACHHMTIAQPQQILLLGQQTSSLLTGDSVPPDGLGQRLINHSGLNRTVTAIHHPRLLLKQPLLKRPTWTALKRLKEPKLT